MLKFILTALLLAFTFNCGGTYCHDYKTEADFVKDRYECDGIANQRSMFKYGQDYFTRGSNVFGYAIEFEDCMQIGKGWYPCSSSKVKPYNDPLTAKEKESLKKRMEFEYN